MTSYKFFLALVSVGFIFLSASFVRADINQSTATVSPSDVSSLLSDYSYYLTSGRTVNADLYSPMMGSLVVERKQYYDEFFEKGLHANLLVLDSQFMLDTAKIYQEGDLFKINVLEKVTMIGKPITTTPDNYPLIRAAKWALDQTSDAEVERLLNDYISTMTQGVNDSTRDGVKIEFLTKHNIEVQKVKDQMMMSNQIKIISDVFSDKNRDSDGFDNVTWTNKGFVRQKPNWEQMVDYFIYRVPIETTGRKLLETFEVLAKASIMAKFPLDDSRPLRSRAVAYISKWTSNPSVSQTCAANIKQNQAKYNPDYKSIWNDPNVACNDCTDYVSQALRDAGFPVDSEWYESVNSRAWVAVNPFYDYFTQNPRGTAVSAIEVTTIGDLAVQLNEHLAMITGTNPHRYSAHTTDCQHCPWNTKFNWFIKPNYYIYYAYGTKLHLAIVKTSAASFNLYNQSPYPSTEDYQINMEARPYPIP